MNTIYKTESVRACIGAETRFLNRYHQKEEYQRRSHCDVKGRFVGSKALGKFPQWLNPRPLDRILGSGRFGMSFSPLPQVLALLRPNSSHIFVFNLMGECDWDESNLFPTLLMAMTPRLSVSTAPPPTTNFICMSQKLDSETEMRSSFDSGDHWELGGPKTSSQPELAGGTPKEPNRASLTRDSDDEDVEFKPFKCPVPDCNRSYKCALS